MVDTPEAARQLLCQLGDHLRDLVVASRDVDMAAVTGASVADTIYGIDKVTDDALVAWFEEHWPAVELVSEGLDDPVTIGTPRWTVIVDPIDGTRGLMYDKRPAWSLAAAAPHGGRLRDVVAAAMTELPTTKQWASDQLSGVRGEGLRAERVDVRTGTRAPLTVRPSDATDLEHGFAQITKFFPPAKVELATIERMLFDRLGAGVVFDDEYIASGGELHELIAGHDRFVADVRPIVDPAALACHPYDLCTAMLLQEVGGVVADPWGDPLDAPLDTTSSVAWAGYANRALHELIAPVLADVLAELTSATRQH